MNCQVFEGIRGTCKPLGGLLLGQWWLVCRSTTNERCDAPLGRFYSVLKWNGGSPGDKYPTTSTTSRLPLVGRDRRFSAVATARPRRHCRTSKILLKSLITKLT